MSVEALAVAALFTNHMDVQDLFKDGEVLWAASTGGVIAYDLDGDQLAELTDLPSRQVLSLGHLNGELTVGTIRGAYRWSDLGWEAVGEVKPVLSVT